MTIYSLDVLLIWSHIVPCPVVTVASWLAYRFLRRQVRWSRIPISWRIFHSSLWSTQLKWPHGLYSPWNSPGQNTGVGICSLLQGIFPTQGLNPGFPHCKWILSQLSHRDPKNTGVGSLSFLQRIFLTQESNQDLLHCRQIFTNWSIREAEIIVRKWYFRRVLSHHSLIISCYTFTSQFCNIGKSSGYLTWIGFLFFLRLLMFIFLPFLSCFALNIWDIW